MPTRETIRARAGSTPGLDSKQIHSLINKNSKLTRILCKNSDTVDSPTPTLPPTRSSSVVSMISASSIDPVIGSGRVIKVAPAKARQSKSDSRWQGLCHSDHDTVSIVSDDSDPIETPRTPVSVSQVELTDADAFPEATISPTSPVSDERSEDVFERVKHAQVVDVEESKNQKLMAFRSLYLDEVVWQIDDMVFAAAIDAVNNNSLMCRLNIEFICEIADENADHVQETRQLSAEDTKLNEMFDGFIDLVQRARRANRNVLVCSTRGRNRAPAFAAAYLMHKEQISRQTAVAKVRKAMGTMRPPVNISDFMQRKLMRYQQHLGIDLSNAYDPSHTLPLFHVKRSAWT
uniref:protein-tyrosine-phosphatase n=1 Tax=Caenorhabditis japonica TaxID=281687 RepID=A0A8R1E124_CAEJA